MPLPILQVTTTPSTADLVRLFHHTCAQRSGQLADPETLDVGTAFANPQLSAVPDANHIHDAALPDGLSPSEAITQVDDHFARQGTRCHYWIMNPSAAEKQTSSLIAHLLANGHHAVSTDILHLHRAPSSPIREVGGLTIVPARASFRHVRQLAQESIGSDRPATDAAQLIDAIVQRLDDPHWDALIALRDSKAVATIGVLAVGDMGRIDDLYVTTAQRRQGIARTLMSRALEICARSLFKHIFIPIAPDNSAMLALSHQCGFRKLATMTTYNRLI